MIRFRNFVAAALVLGGLSFLQAPAAMGAGFQTNSELPPPQAWSKIDLSGWKPKVAGTLMGLFGAMFTGYAEFDGAQTMSININVMSSEDAYEVFIVQNGYGDDSVSGARWAAVVKHGEKGWFIDRMWRQQLCARGQNKNKWSKEKCL